jgi:hypothetical protein
VSYLKEPHFTIRLLKGFLLVDFTLYLVWCDDILSACYAVNIVLVVEECEFELCYVPYFSVLQNFAYCCMDLNMIKIASSIGNTFAHN